MRFTIFSILILYALNLFGQISQPARYEIELGSLNESFFTASAEENGLFIFKQNPLKSTYEENIWDVIWLDTALQVVFKREIPLTTNYFYKGATYSNNHLVLLFQSGVEFESEAEFAQDILFISYIINNDDFIAYKYENLVPINISHLEMKDDAIIFGGSLKKRTVVSLFNVPQQKGMVLPGFFNNESELQQINVNPANDHIKIITSEEQRDQSFDIVTRSFSNMGRLLETKKISANRGANLTNAFASQEYPNSSFISSTYSLSRPFNKSDGILISDFTNNHEIKSLNYNKFTDFEHFFNYQGTKRADRLKRKITRKRKRGKDLDLNFYVKLNDVQFHRDENIMIGEIYKPQSKKSLVVDNGYANQFQKEEITQAENIRSYNYNWHRIPTSNYITYGYNSIYRFDHLLPIKHTNNISGFEYSQAFIYGFDKFGKKLWDNSIVIDDLISHQLKTYVYSANLNDQMVLLYLNDQHIHSKVIKENATIKDKTSEPLRLYSEADVLNNSISYFEGIKKWHGNTFYAYGVNSVTNTKISIDNERKVFFINKIVVE